MNHVYTKIELLQALQASRAPAALKATANLLLMTATDQQLAQISPMIDRVVNAVLNQDLAGVMLVLAELGIDQRTIATLTRSAQK